MAFWKPGTLGPGLAEPTSSSVISGGDRETEVEKERGSDYIVYNPWHSLSINQQRVKLPIFQYSYLATFSFLI